jgi:hypothetical protein
MQDSHRSTYRRLLDIKIPAEMTCREAGRWREWSHHGEHAEGAAASVGTAYERCADA